MAKLNAKERKSLPSKDFAGPGRSYPDENKGHAKAAIARASEFASPKVKAEVDAAVHRKYPSMGKPKEHPMVKEARSVGVHLEMKKK